MKRLKFLYPIVTSASVQFFFPCIVAANCSLFSICLFVCFFWGGQNLCNHSKILLIELAQEWTGTKL